MNERGERAVAAKTRAERPESSPQADADTSAGVPAEGGRAGALAVGATAVGTLARGALALGALAIGALAVGRLAIGQARIRKLVIDELQVRRITRVPRRR